MAGGDAAQATCAVGDRARDDDRKEDPEQRAQNAAGRGASGRLAAWDRFDDLERITVPTLVIGAAHDTMDPAYMQTMAERLPKGTRTQEPTCTRAKSAPGSAYV